MLPDSPPSSCAIGRSGPTWCSAGADFGTGIWDLTAGSDMAAARRASSARWRRSGRRTTSGSSSSWSSSGPRSRARSARSPRRSRSRSSSRPSGSSCAAAPSPCAARRPASSSSVRSAPSFALSSLLVPFFLGAAVGGVAGERVPGETRQATRSRAGLNGLSLLVGALGVVTGRTSRRSSSARTPSRGRGGARRQVQDARAHLGGGGRGVRAGRPRGRAQRGAGALGRAHLRARPRLRTAVSPWPVWRRLARVDRRFEAAAGSSPWRSARSSPPGSPGSSPTCCRPT